MSLKDNLMENKRILFEARSTQYKTVIRCSTFTKEINKKNSNNNYYLLINKRYCIIGMLLNKTKKQLKNKEITDVEII